MEHVNLSEQSISLYFFFGIYGSFLKLRSTRDFGELVNFMCRRVCEMGLEVDFNNLDSWDLGEGACVCFGNLFAGISSGNFDFLSITKKKNKITNRCLTFVYRIKRINYYWDST